MKECVAARDKLTKFVDKLDACDPSVKLLLSYNDMRWSTCLGDFVEVFSNQSKGATEIE